VTLALAIKATDAIIIAADSRGTIGDPRGLTAVNDTQQKIFQFGRCGLAISGAAELAQSLMDEFGKRGINNPENVDNAAAAITQAANIYDGWFQGVANEQRPGIFFVLGGYRYPPDGAAPVPMVYFMGSNMRFAPQLGRLSNDGGCTAICGVSVASLL
jgi:20S proteasome alpha/beta subunit